MGYRGKVREQEEARRLRSKNWTLAAIAKELGVSKSSVSLWVRDLNIGPILRSVGTGPRRQRRDARVIKIAEANRRAVLRLGVLDERSFLAAGAALYAGEGTKRDGNLQFSNSDASLMRF